MNNGIYFSRWRRWEFAHGNSCQDHKQLLSAASPGAHWDVRFHLYHLPLVTLISSLFSSSRTSWEQFRRRQPVVQEYESRKTTKEIRSQFYNYQAEITGTRNTRYVAPLDITFGMVSKGRSMVTTVSRCSCLSRAAIQFRCCVYHSHRWQLQQVRLVFQHQHTHPQPYGHWCTIRLVTVEANVLLETYKCSGFYCKRWSDVRTGSASLDSVPTDMQRHACQVASVLGRQSRWFSVCDQRLVRSMRTSASSIYKEVPPASYLGLRQDLQFPERRVLQV